MAGSGGELKRQEKNRSTRLTDAVPKNRNTMLYEVLEYWCNNGELTSYDDVIIALREAAG